MVKEEILNVGAEWEGMRGSDREREVCNCKYSTHFQDPPASFRSFGARYLSERPQANLNPAIRKVLGNPALIARLDIFEYTLELSQYLQL